MKTSKTPLSIKIIYWFTQVIFGLFLLVCLAIIAFNVLLFTDFFGNDLQLHTRFPVKVNILETGNLYLNKINIKVELVEGITQIHFFNTPLFLARWFGSALIMVAAVFMYILISFRSFISNVKKQVIFVEDNIQHLKNISYAFLILWVFAIVYVRIMYQAIGKNVEFKHVEILHDYPNFAGLLMLALFIWVLSHIFMTGVKLQEEQNLTV
ncbi:MAG: DUF2975 domain-containing protein [Bacteroidales bacterium]|nr:DUF2975 domain-containing protein [Bacteroidales bacterium]